MPIVLAVPLGLAVVAAQFVGAKQAVNLWRVLVRPVGEQRAESKVSFTGRWIAMKMVGHKTESIYQRYAIVDEQMHREAAAKLDAWADEQQEKAKAEAKRSGQVKKFREQRAG